MSAMRIEAAILHVARVYRSRAFGASCAAVKPKHLIPNFFTLANIAFGFFSMLAAAQGRYERAVLCLFGAAVCDLLDGKLARMLDASTRFGMELDSLSDAISFGIAPGLLVYLSVLSRLGTVGSVIAIGYVLTAVVRLARYNVDTATIGKVTFQGVPTPIAAGYLMSFVMVRDALPIHLVAAGTGLMAVLMVSTLKIPKFRPGQGLPFAMLIFGIGTFVGFLFRPGALTWHIWNGWNLILVVSNYVLLGRGGYLSGTAPPERPPANEPA
jgi:CDP-diacylglycerol---serine O-phosphatidyltransferase